MHDCLARPEYCSALATESAFPNNPCCMQCNRCCISLCHCYYAAPSSQKHLKIVRITYHVFAGNASVGVTLVQRTSQASSISCSSRHSSVVAHAVQALPAPAAAEELSRVFYEQGVLLEACCLLAGGLCLFIVMCLTEQQHKTPCRNLIVLDVRAARRLCTYGHSKCAVTVAVTAPAGRMHTPKCTWQLAAPYIARLHLSAAVKSVLPFRPRTSPSSDPPAAVATLCLSFISAPCLADSVTVVATKDARGIVLVEAAAAAEPCVPPAVSCAVCLALLQVA